MPVLVYEEVNCVKNHGSDLAAYGKRAMLVTGRHSAKANGAFQDVTEALEEAGILWFLFDEVEENPSVETVMRARAIGLENQVDFVVGIGGGSPLDAAKAIALMICNKNEDETFLDKKVPKVKSLPVIAVPTTCGTGSEVTGISVLTRHQKRTKASMIHRIYPDLALVDAKYLQFMPKSVLCNTAVDALAHLVESYINSSATDYSRMFASEGLRVWSRSKDVLEGKREPEREDYRNMMNASTYAGMAIAHTGTAIPHALSYCITYELGVPHGKAVGYFLPGYLKEAAPKDRDYVLSLIGFEDAEAFADYIREVCSIEPLNLDIVERAVTELSVNEAKLKTSPYRVDSEVLKRISGVYKG